MSFIKKKKNALKSSRCSTLAPYRGFTSPPSLMVDFLFRDGEMNPMDIEYMYEDWEKSGLKGVAEIDGKPQWKDFCVIESLGPTLPCEWLEFDRERNAVFMKDFPKGDLCGPDWIRRNK